MNWTNSHSLKGPEPPPKSKKTIATIDMSKLNAPEKSKIVLLGAYDRYNYGDNLMPIVLVDYMKKFYPHLVDSVDFIYASISESDLTRFGAQKTVSINDACRRLTDNDTLVVVGGEVLCSPNSTLYLHMPRKKVLNDILTKFNRRPTTRSLLNAYARLRYPTPWNFPYIPDPKKLPKSLKIIYNTVGGNLSSISPREKSKIVGRLNGAALLAVRDSRTAKNLEGIQLSLVPDSVHIISELYDQNFFAENAREMQEKYQYEDYFCFQASPKKLSEDINIVADVLRKICRQNNCKVMLLPIGYASGHDDSHLLKKLHSLLPDIAFYEDNLTLWNIMFLIKNSSLYIGTSLHGAITALSYAVPHFGLNKGPNRKIPKLDGFLGDWSVPPFNRTQDIQTIGDLSANIKKFQRHGLKERADANNHLIRKHFDQIIKMIDSQNNSHLEKSGN